MLIRQLIIAALALSACAAHADVISSGSTGAAAQSGFLSGWTGANGSDVLSSGILSNVSLIGGISYSAAANASGDASATLADVLYGKASATIGQGSDGKTTMYYKQGIEGVYLLGSGHGILAAMLGNGVSVVGSNEGVIIGKGETGSGDSKGGTLSPTPAAAAIPEPSSVALMLAGVLGAGALTRRRRQR